MSLMLTHALRYLKMGFSVIPLEPRGKKPIIDWKEYQTRKATEAELHSWFQSGQNNVGIVLGSISNLVALDVDGLCGLQYLTTLTLRSPVTVLTGSGAKHLYFKYNGEEPKRIWKGPNAHEELFLRSTGEYVVAPPSLHPNGRRYRFVGVGIPGILPQFPPSLLNVSVSEKKEVTASQESWISDALGELSNGHVHNNLVSILGRFRRHNFSVADTVALLRPYASEGGMSDEELNAKVEEIWGRYEPPSYGNVSTALLGARSSEENVGVLSIKSPGNESDYAAYLDIPRSTSEAIRSGLSTLDGWLEGGLKSERLFTIAARTGENKTNTGLSVAKSLCEQDQKVLYFSTEFSYRKIWDRYIAQLKDPSSFRKHALYVCDSFSPNLEQVETAIKEIKPDFFFFDYIQHIAEEKEGLGKFMQGLTFLQKKYNTQGIVLAQLNRYADFVQDGKRIEPRLSMIKGSDSIGQMSSRVLLLSVTKVSPEVDEIEAILDKNDSGSKGKFFLGLYKNPYQVREIK